MGTGASLALPWLECMAADKAAAPKQRFFAGYFAYGVPMPADNAPDRLEHGWFPLGEGKDYEAPAMHENIMPHYTTSKHRLLNSFAATFSTC